MAVSREDVLRVAALARLELSDEEVEGLARDLSGILSHVEALEEIEHRASSIEHRASGGDDLPGAAGLRADEPGADPLSGGPGDFAPAFRDGFFLVPRLASHGNTEDTGAEIDVGLRERPDGDGDGDSDEA